MLEVYTLRWRHMHVRRLRSVLSMSCIRDAVIASGALRSQPAFALERLDARGADAKSSILLESHVPIAVVRSRHHLEAFSELQHETHHWRVSLEGDVIAGTPLSWRPLDIDTLHMSADTVCGIEMASSVSRPI